MTELYKCLLIILLGFVMVRPDSYRVAHHIRFVCLLTSTSLSTSRCKYTRQNHFYLTHITHGLKPVAINPWLPTFFPCLPCLPARQADRQAYGKVPVINRVFFKKVPDVLSPLKRFTVSYANMLHNDISII
jgi:hypothetical protein